MKTYKVIFSPLAREQMEKLGEYISEEAGSRTALTYLSKIHAHCKSLRTAPLRGRPRPDLHPNLRVIGFGKNVNIAFSVYEKTVIIQSVFSGGQNIDSLILDKGIP